MWFYGMDNLGSEMKSLGTNTNSRKSTLSLRVSFGLRVESKSKNLISHSFFINEMWLSKIGDSISRSICTGINVSLKNWSKLGKDTGVNIDSKMKTESQGWGSRSHSHSSSISLNAKLANLFKVWSWSSSNLCDEIESWSKSPRHQDSSFLSIWLGQSGMVEHVLGRVFSF